MAPDLNTIPTHSQSNSPAQTPTTTQPRSIATAMNSSNIGRDTSVSPRPSTHSLAAAATMNATERRSSTSRASPRLDRQSSGRRRSQVAMNLSLNDPGIPSPGELSSADQRRLSGVIQHHRQPSLGDIHNELEQEQEAQVNRMLSMIRSQQHQLDTLRAQQSNASAPGNTQSNSAAVEDNTPASERSFSFPSVHPAVSAPRPRIPSRENSTSNTSTTATNATLTRSPALRPLPSADFHDFWPPSPAESRSSRRNSLRDEGAYFQAEQANLQRENQMLRVRIRELEKQLVEKQNQGAGQAQSSPSSVPAQRSNLVANMTLEGAGRTEEET